MSTMISSDKSERFDRAALVAELVAAGGECVQGAWRCPFHQDSTPSGSIYVSDGGVWRYKCHAPGCVFFQPGDVYDLRAMRTGQNVGKVLNGSGSKEMNAPTASLPKKENEKKLVSRSIKDIRKLIAEKYGVIKSEHFYINPDSHVTDLLVIRYLNKQSGKKSYFPFQPVGYGFDFGKPKGRAPIYARERVSHSDTVLFVEGEKCADAAAHLGIVASTGPGGSGGAEHIDLSPLAGKTITLWADNDAPGVRYMDAIQQILSTLVPAPVIRRIDHTRLGLPEGGDIVDYLEKIPGGVEEKRRAVLALIDSAAVVFDPDSPDSSAASSQPSFDPASVISEFNSRHAVVSIGANVVILRERFEPNSSRVSVDFLRKPDFNVLYENRFIESRDLRGQLKKEPAAKYWLQHPDRRTYEQVVFDPGGSDPRNYNLWRGFAVDPAPGDWSLFRDHIMDNICSGDDSLFEYVLAWMADAVKNPNDRPGVAIVLRGKQGTGKGVFCREFGSLFGQHFTHISQSRHLTGNFNNHLKDCLLLFADEAFWAGDKAGEGALKALITEPDFLIEMKGRDAIRMPNRVRLMIASNSDWIIPAGMEERRFCVIDVAESHMQDHSYFALIRDQMMNGGRAALLHDLLAHDLTKSNLRRVPQTNALFEQKIHSMKPVEHFWFSLLQRGRFFENDVCWREFVRKDHLYDQYDRVTGRAGVSRRAFEMEFSIALNRLCPSITDDRRTLPIYDDTGNVTASTRQRVWIIPSLGTCRNEFSSFLQYDIPWEAEDGFDDGDSCAEVRDDQKSDDLLPF